MGPRLTLTSGLRRMRRQTLFHVPGLKKFRDEPRPAGLMRRAYAAAGVDREDLNFSTLSVGDAFWQVSQLTLPANLTPGSYPVEVGWYNPETGERLKRDDGSDRFLLTPLEVIAP